MESLKRLIHVSIFMILISFFNPSFCDHQQPLDTLIHDYVNNNISYNPTAPRTGLVRNLALPSFNSSTVQLSVVRLRSGSLWTRGKNISAFQIPSMIIPIPYVKRLVLVTSNFDHHDLSSHYFTPPQGYVFASPVVGLAVYNASTTAFLSNTSIDIYVAGGPIIITFDDHSNDDALCVGFGKNGIGGEVLGMMSSPAGQCSVYSQGYFATVVRDSRQGRRRSSSSRKWVVGAVVIGLVLIGVLVMCFVWILLWKMVERKRIKEMERQSEKEVGVGTMWIGQSRLPTGNMCRTQPQLESEMFP